MVISSGVVDGQPVTALFVRGFMAKGNLLNIFYGLVIQCILLCGVALTLIGGNIDLSVSGQATLGSMAFALMLQRFPQLPWVVALVTALLLRACFGIANTLLVGKLSIPSFIATIGMASIYRGLCNVLRQGENVQINRADLRALMETRIFGRFPLTFLVAIAFVIIYSFILSRTTFGRNIFLVGGNKQAARLSGVNTDRIVAILFINNGVLAVLGGVLWSSAVRLASPTAIVSSEPGFSVISASVLGGVSFGGGAGTLGSPFVALLLLSVFSNMLTVVGIQPYWNVFAQGLILVIALIIGFIGERRRQNALIGANP